jgi:hypothetical protein
MTFVRTVIIHWEGKEHLILLHFTALYVAEIYG